MIVPVTLTPGQDQRSKMYVLVNLSPPKPLDEASSNYACT